MSIKRVSSSGQRPPARGMHLPPMALVSLNCGDDLVAQAEAYERFAATEASLSETGGREKFWRSAAALRIVAEIARADVARFSDLCALVDKARARS